MTKNDIGTIILNWLKGFFTKNLALKIVSLLFAMLIWGYVMVEVNPKRVKTITDVPISFSGESSLHDRGLAVRGDRDDILRNVTVRVKVQLTDYTGLDASDISASVSLRPVNKADTYKLKIDATSSLGTVENVSPSEITIEVDELATMLVPIDVEYSGELPEGYWKSEPTLASQSIKVSGPRDDVSTISKAICTINLEDRTTSYNEAILLKYVDKNGDEIDTALFLDTLPSVVVKMDVLRIVELPINAAEAVLGADALPYYTFFDADNKLDWQRRVAAITEKSLYDTGVTPAYGTQLLTLSTCRQQLKRAAEHRDNCAGGDYAVGRPEYNGICGHKGKAGQRAVQGRAGRD